MTTLVDDGLIFYFYNPCYTLMKMPSKLLIKKMKKVIS